MTDSKKDFIKEFSIRRKKFRPWAIFGIIAFLFAIVGAPILYLTWSVFGEIYTVYLTIILLLLIPVIYKMIQFSRCPSCKKYMGRDIGSFCTRCGVQIQK